MNETSNHTVADGRPGKALALAMFLGRAPVLTLVALASAAALMTYLCMYAFCMQLHKDLAYYDASRPEFFLAFTWFMSGLGGLLLLESAAYFLSNVKYVSCVPSPHSPALCAENRLAQ